MEDVSRKLQSYVENLEGIEDFLRDYNRVDYKAVTAARQKIASFLEAISKESQKIGSAATDDEIDTQKE